MAPLVHARRDGRLGPRDIASLDRHLASCGACAKLAGDLDTISDLVRRPRPRLSPLEQQRRRVRLLQEAATPAAQPRGAWGLRAALALGVAAAVILGYPRPADRAFLTHLPAHSLRTAVHPSSAEEPSRTETTVHGGHGARFERRATGAVEVVHLEDGALDVSVKHLLAGERFLVRTVDAEVEVRGTVFHVVAEAARLREVAVSEGVVEVRREGNTYTIHAGESWTAPAAARTDEPVSVGTPHTPAPAASARPSVSAAASAAPTLGPSEVPPPRNEASTDFAEAVAMVDRGDYGAAAERLEAFRRQHPGDARVEDAAFLRIVALQHAGRTGAAAVAARRYLADFPHGARRAEAETIAAPR